MSQLSKLIQVIKIQYRLKGVLLLHHMIHTLLISLKIDVSIDFSVNFL